MVQLARQTLLDARPGDHRDDAAKEWQTVNDGVTGAVSEGKFKITDKKTLEFFGTLSLENNGGFASVRTRIKKLGLEKGDTLVAKVRGDGNEWIEVKVPLDKFEATSFGRPVKGPVQ